MFYRKCFHQYVYRFINVIIWKTCNISIKPRASHGINVIAIFITLVMISMIKHLIVSSMLYEYKCIIAVTYVNEFTDYLVF